MNLPRLECLKLSWLRERQPTKMEKNPEGYLLPNRNTPNHIQPPDHHCHDNDLVGLLEYIGDLLTREDHHARPSLSPLTMADVFWHLLVDRIRGVVEGGISLCRLSVLFENHGCTVLLLQLRIPDDQASLSGRWKKEIYCLTEPRTQKRTSPA